MQLRERLETWHRQRAQARMMHWREALPSGGHDDALPSDAWLLGRPAHEAWREAAASGELDPSSARAMAAHLGEAAAERAWAEALDALDARLAGPVNVAGHALALPALWEEIELTSSAPRRHELAVALEAHLQPLAARCVDASQRAEHARMEAVDATLREAHEQSLAKLQALAERVLERGRPLVEEARAHLLRDEQGRTGTWHALWHAMRGRSLDGLLPRRERWRRLAHSVQAFEVQRDLDAYLRAEPHHAWPSARVELAALDVPRDVRVAPCRLERGVLSELAAFAGLGRGLAHVLRNPALPVELRRTADPQVADALGELLAQLLADPVYLRRGLGLDASAAETWRRHVACVQVLQLQLEAARLLVSCRAQHEGVEARIELGRQQLHGALGIEAPACLAVAVTLEPTRAARRFRAHVVGLALHVGLRDAWDEDWFRNPRIAEPLRAACARGGLLDAEAWCDEVGVSPDACLSRVGEWLA